MSYFNSNLHKTVFLFHFVIYVTIDVSYSQNILTPLKFQSHMYISNSTLNYYILRLDAICFSIYTYACP